MNTKGPNRKIMPDFGDQTSLKILSPEIITLDNGLKVYIINDSSIDFTRFEFVFWGGTAVQKKNVVAECTLNLMNEGSKSLTGEQIATHLDYHGAYFEPLLTKDKSSLAVYTLTKYQDKILNIIHEIVHNPLYDELNLRNYLNRKKHKYTSDLEKVKFKAMIEFNRLVFGNNTPYGKTKQVEDYENVTQDDLFEHHAKYYFTSNNYIIVAGKVSSNIIEALNSLFGQNKLADIHDELRVNYQNSFTSGLHTVSISDSMQSAIRIGRQIIPKTHKDYHSFVVLNTILGGYFGSRLMSNLREKNGYTYGINSFILNFINADYWSISTQVNIDQTYAAIDEINSEIEKLKSKPVELDELKLVKNYLYGTYLRSFDGPMSMADRLRASIDLNLDISHYKNNLNRIMCITSEEIIQVANTYLNQEDFLYLVIGKNKL